MPTAFYAKHSLITFGLPLSIKEKGDGVSLCRLLLR